MTTIATDGKTMAADGRMTRGTMIAKEDCDKMYKVFVEHAGETLLIGAAGTVAHIEDIIEHIKESYQGEGVFLGTTWTMDVEEDVPHPEGTAALVLTEQGKVFYAGYGENVYEVYKLMAIGTGGDYAIGAMAAGKTPAEAVIIASRFDTNTNSIVTEKRLG